MCSYSSSVETSWSLLSFRESTTYKYCRVSFTSYSLAATSSNFIHYLVTIALEPFCISSDCCKLPSSRNISVHHHLRTRQIMGSAVAFAAGHSNEFHAYITRLSHPDFSQKRPQAAANDASQPISRRTSIDKRFVNWGRRFKSHWAATLSSICIMTLAPCLVIFTWIALEKLEGSLLDTGLSLLHHGSLEFVILYGPRLRLPEFAAYVAWFLFQAGLYSCLPAPLRTGQLTPAGHLLQ